MFPVSNVVSPPSVGPDPAGLDAAVKAAYSGIPPPAATPKDPYTDDKALLERFSKASKECKDRRTAFERVWWRTILYLLGRQWIYYERQANQWVDKRLQKWVPRPVTNKIAEIHNTILSVFQSVDLSVACRPAGSDPADIMAADTANKYEPPLRDDHDMMRVQDDSDWWLVALGNVWWHTWWDYSGDSQMAFVPWEQCVVCTKVHSPVAVKAAGNACPECGSPILNKAVDDQGQPIGMNIQCGHGRTDAVSPLEVSFPPIYANPADTPKLIRRRWRSKDYLEQRLSADQLAKITWETTATERSLQMLRSLASMTEIGGMTNSGMGGEPSEGEGVSEAELWEKPSKDYPNGLVMRVIDATSDGDGILLRMPDEGLPGPLPFTTNEGRKIWPWVHTGYEKFGGRGWARSPLEHLIEKQNQLNQLDSLIQMIVQRTANPVWLEPKGSEVTKFSGEPGLVVKYNPLGAGGGAKPERIEGSNIPSSLAKLREMILMDLEKLSGTSDIINGQKPAGVDSFSGMQLLVERSQSRYGKVLEARGVAYRQWFRIALDMERKFGSDERAYAILGPNGGFTRVAFQKAQLDGSIRIEVEDGSQMPKTSLGMRAAIQQLQALNVIDPKNPETGYEILQIFGQTRLYPGLDAQVLGARRVQQAFEAWASTAQFVQPPAQPMVGPTGAMILDPMTQRPAMQPPGPPQPTTPPPGQLQPWMKSEVYLAEHMKWASGDAVQKLIAQQPLLIPVVGALITQHQQAIISLTPPIPPKVAFSFKGPDLIDPQVRQVFDRIENVTAPAPDPASIAQPSSAPTDHVPGGVGGGRAMHNSNQESGNPNDLAPPPSRR